MIHRGRHELPACIITAGCPEVLLALQAEKVKRTDFLPYHFHPHIFSRLIRAACAAISLPPPIPRAAFHPRLTHTLRSATAASAEDTASASASAESASASSSAFESASSAGAEASAS